jgi:cellulose synthase/poly-beta-1,6-N-acetylglucosamine synthase-like glycosyltransferase
MSFKGLSFNLLLAISCAIPAIAILAGVKGQIEYFFLISALILAYDFGQWLFVLGMTGIAFNDSHFQPQPTTPPSLTVIIPAWNEASALPLTLATVLEQDDPPDAIIVSDDGSTDKTLCILNDFYDLKQDGNRARSRRYPHLQVLFKEHSGKGDSINQAVALSDTDFGLILDADTRLYPGSIRALRQTLAQYPDLDVVSGTLIPCCSKSWLGRAFQFFQRYEYSRLHLWRLAWSQFDSTLIVSGACSAFNRQVLLEIGGFYSPSWVEDYEIMYRLQRHKRVRNEVCRVMVLPELCVQTEAPDTIYSFLRQRRRWAGGFLETMVQYRYMVGDRRYGILGLGYLVHNAFSIAHPFYSLAWLIASFALAFHDRSTSLALLWLLAIAIGLGAMIVSLAAIRYRRYFQRREVSALGAAVEWILRPIFYLPLNALSHVWGYSSYLRRQKSW